MSEQNFGAFLEVFQSLHDKGEAFAVATLVDAVGETPQNPGARIVMTPKEIAFGTIGGGKLENRVLTVARDELAKNSPRRNFYQELNLQRDLGMTCGGVVRIFFEIFKPQMQWKIAVFGAGHVSQALCPLLLTLDCEVSCFDTRAEWIEKLPAHPRLRKKVSANLEEELKTLGNESFVVLITMGHSSDSPLLVRALREKNFRYLGVMGSDVKAKRLRRDVLEAGLPAEACERFFSPIGEPFGNNSPAEIAMSITAQLLKQRDSAPVSN